MHCSATLLVSFLFLKVSLNFFIKLNREISEIMPSQSWVRQLENQTEKWVSKSAKEETWNVLNLKRFSASKQNEQI